MSAFDIYDLGQMIVDASEDDHLAETQLMSLIQMMKVLLAKHEEEPQAALNHQPQVPYQNNPIQTPRATNMVKAAREADSGTPDYILDPANPNSKAMRGRVRNMEQASKKQFAGEGEEDESGGGFDL
eukprot:GHVR01102964.1.p1 GENE.GHVR01102964.1~~GHVR01102964.1.p1  ORF type:complete len:127 (-),score=26.00 GHVR01102964.1:375-755(-)